MPTKPSSRRSRSARRQRIVGSWLIALVGGAVATFGDAAPTALPSIDGAYRAAYVIAVAVACAFGRRWTWPVVAAVAVLPLPDLPWLVVGGLALAAAVVAQLDRRRRQPVGALIGVLAGLTLLQLPPMVGFGFPSLLAATAPLPAAISAVRNARSRTRRHLAVASAVTGAAVAVVVTVAGVGAVLLRTEAGRGVSAAQAGLQALHTGDEATAVAAFAEAGDSFDRAQDLATSWWMSPARLVPVASQHIEVARVLSDEGVEIAEVAARTAPAASLEGITTPTGAFRIDHIEELGALAGDIVDTLTATDGRLANLETRWLAGPARSAVRSLRDEVERARSDAELSHQALEVAPDLLGADAPRRYVVLFGNPAEARLLGGFVASVGVLEAVEGTLDYHTIGSSGALSRSLVAADATLDADVPVAYRNAQPERYAQNWTSDIDIATVTAAVADLAPQVPELGAVDGVLYADPLVLAAMLELTGAVTVPDTAQRLDAGDAAAFLLREQYRGGGTFLDGDRKERLGDAAEIAFDRLLGPRPPAPRAVATTLAPLVQARRLLFSTTDPAAHQLLSRVKLRPQLHDGDGETVLVAHGNRRANKLDAYLDRAITYDATVADDGTVEATLTVTLTNTATLTRVSDYQLGHVRFGEEPGTNHLSLHVHSALRIGDVHVDGDLAPRNQLRRGDLHQVEVPVSVAPGASVVVRAALTGTVDPRSCMVSFLPNAGAGIDSIEATLDLPGGMRRLPRRALDRQLTLSCVPS